MMLDKSRVVLNVLPVLFGTVNVCDLGCQAHSFRMPPDMEKAVYIDRCIADGDVDYAEQCTVQRTMASIIPFIKLTVEFIEAQLHIH